MERRSFIHASIWSAIGCTLLPAETLARPSRTYKTAVLDLLEILGFKKQNLFSIEESLFLCGKKELDDWFETGYTPLHHSLFWQVETDYAILPVQLLNTQLNEMDYCTLHFSKSPVNDWVYCGSLSGFHIEAIHRAILKLPTTNVDSSHYRQLFLPIASNDEIRSNKGAYCTSLGTFELKANINDGHTLVNARLIRSGKILWKDEYYSNHLLVYKSQNVIC